MKRDDTAAIYHELSGRYGQTMTMQDACRELNFKKPETVKKVMPAGWIGAKGGLRIKTIIKTISFARQLAEMSD